MPEGGVFLLGNVKYLAWGVYVRSEEEKFDRKVFPLWGEVRESIEGGKAYQVPLQTREQKIRRGMYLVGRAGNIVSHPIFRQLTP